MENYLVFSIIPPFIRLDLRSRINLINMSTKSQLFHTLLYLFIECIFVL